MPLRASAFHRHQLPTIIFLTDLCHMDKESGGLSTFPDILIRNVKYFH